MQKLLATKGAHLPPQPQVLASIVGSHSRLGSITERLAKALPTFSRPGRILACSFLGPYGPSELYASQKRSCPSIDVWPSSKSDLNDVTKFETELHA